VAFDGGREEEGDREEGATKEEDREGEGEEGEGDLMGRLRRVGMLVESAATMGSEPGGGSRRRHATSAEEAEERSEARVESAMSTDIVPPGPMSCALMSWRGTSGSTRARKSRFGLYV